MPAKTKSELLAEAKDLGAPVDDSNTAVEIQTAVDKAKAEDAEDAKGSKGTSDEQKAVMASASSKPSPSDRDAAALRESAASNAAVQTPAVASTGVVQGPGGNAYELGQNESVPAAEAIGAAEDIDVDTLPRSVLMQLKGLVDGALGKKGLEPQRPVTPDLNLIVGTYPLNEDAMGKLQIADVAGKFEGIEEADVASFAVRQQRGADGTFLGDKYLRVVTHEGKKHTVQV